MVADWREDYNQHRPHSSLGMTAPARFAASWRLNAETAKGITTGTRPPGRRSPHSAPALTEPGQRSLDADSVLDPRMWQ